MIMTNEFNDYNSMMILKFKDDNMIIINEFSDHFYDDLCMSSMMK